MKENCQIDCHGLVDMKNPELRLIACGNRDWTRKDLIKRALESIDEQAREHRFTVSLMHGDCRGADKLAGEVATELSWEVIAVPAEWDLHHKAAGPIRNKVMLSRHDPQLVLAFHNNLRDSSGTAHMLRIAFAADITTLRVDHEGRVWEEHN